jgi:YHS domain-containing protein
MKTSIDPICGMTVDIKTAKENNLISSNEGKNYYFCSNNCKDKFEGKKSKVPWYQSDTFGKSFPWFLGITLVLGTFLSITYNFMVLYMGIFFIIFSLFKAIDWKGFIAAFKEYDIPAKLIPGYSAIYPALEFSIGILFIVNFYVENFYLIPLAWVTLTIMAVGAVGVSIKLLKNEKFQCACLGTKIKVPLTKVTLLENLLMAFMAAMLLFF